MLHLQPDDSKEAQDDRHSASQLVKRWKQRHSSGLSTKENRYVACDKTESSWIGKKVASKQEFHTHVPCHEVDLLNSRLLL